MTGNDGAMTNRDDYAILVGVESFHGAAADKHRGGVTALLLDLRRWLEAPEGGALPKRNVVLLAPAEAPRRQPESWQVRRALGELGVGGGGRVGRRLYAIFVGFAAGRSMAELSLLFGDAAPDGATPAAFGLQDWLTQQAGSFTFDELVLVADVEGSGIVVTPTPTPLPFAAPSRLEPEKPQFVLVGSGVLPSFLALLISSRDTPITLDAALLLPAAGDTQSVASAGALRAIRPLASRSGAIVIGPVAQAPPRLGTLVLDLPHWAAHATLLDGRSRPVAAFQGMVASGGGTRRSLAAGRYMVEVRLGGAVARRSILVAPGGEETLRFECRANADGALAGGLDVTDASTLALQLAAPLAGFPGIPAAHLAAARRWSVAVTWTALPQQRGEAGLFVFFRCLQPETSSQVMAGLSLLDNDGNLLVRLDGEAVVRDAAAGWMAFATRLRPGYYILRHDASSGATQERCQGVYLVAGWDVQVFIPVLRHPSLSRMVYDLVPTGSAFDPAGSAIALVQLLLHAMHAGAANAMARALLPSIAQARQAPWLRILAAQALVGSPSADTALRQALDPVDGLDPALMAHPDLAALRLLPPDPATPFTHPPLLRAGLRLVQDRAARQPATVSPQGLSARIAGSLVTDSPWTAWSGLSVPPTEPAGPRVMINQVLRASFPPKAPIFPVVPPPAADASAMLGGAGGRASARSLTPVLRDIGFVGAANDLLNAGLDNFAAGHDVVVGLRSTARTLLDSVSPATFSAATGRPREHVERIFSRLGKAAGLAVSEPPQADMPEATPQAAKQISIEEVAATLRAGGERLRRLAAAGSLLAARLEQAAAIVLRAGDLVALVDATLHLRFVNGALATRLQSGDVAIGGFDGLDRSLRRAAASGRDPTIAEAGTHGGPRIELGAIRRESGGDAEGFIAVVRPGDAAPLAPGSLAEIAQLLPRLDLFSLLAVHPGSADRPDTAQGPDYLILLNDIITHVESLLGATPFATLPPGQSPSEAGAPTASMTPQ